MRDILYAVGIAPQKLGRVHALRAEGCDLSVILDPSEQAEAVAEASRAAGRPTPALVEIDSDGQHGGCVTVTRSWSQWGASSKPQAPCGA